MFEAQCDVVVKRRVYTSRFDRLAASKKLKSSWRHSH